MQTCSTSPMTGFHRDGCCRTGPVDHGVYSVCALMTDEFLPFSAAQGNDLSTPAPAVGFPGLRPGDGWCLCVYPPARDATRIDARCSVHYARRRSEQTAPLPDPPTAHRQSLESVIVWPLERPSAEAIPMPDQPCDHCTYGIPAAAERCPHCALPGLFPNMRAATRSENVAMVEARYHAAVMASKATGREVEVRAFEVALESSVVVIGRSLNEVERLAASDRQGYSTYYQLIEGETRIPDADKWDKLRRIADTTVFPGYEDKIRFAALSLDGVSILSYGDCFLVCSDKMIRHRATVFEENTTMFVLRHFKPSGVDTNVEEILDGHRATFEARAALCVAKLADRVKSGATPVDHVGLLVRPGKDSGDDEFVEVNIWGPMTIRTFSRVILQRKRVRRKSMVDSLRERLEKFDVKLEVR